MKRAAKAPIYNLYEAKTALSKLVDEAARGEEIVIAKAGKPMAKLVPLASKPKPRNLGRNLMGITYVAPDFDEPAFSDAELNEWGF